MGANLGDVCHPELVGGINIKLPVQGIVGHDSRTATIRAGLLFVTNLGPYARQTGQTPRPIGADVFTKVARIIMQLAVHPSRYAAGKG